MSDIESFKDSGLGEELIKAVTDLGYETPTPIQKLSIGVILDSDEDLLALAQTGTGKTAAFSLPILEKIDTSDHSVQAVILSPTRELCLQIATDIEKFTKYKRDVKSLAVYGGTSIGPQIKTLKKGVQVVIGTPGRTLDLINRGKLDVSAVKYLVLDEADEMLSMGFKDELDAILANSPEEKQVLLFSATMPKEIRHIAQKYMKNTREVKAGEVNVSNDRIKHMYYMVSAKDRYLALKRIADIHPNIYSIVFCRTRAETKDVAEKLGQDGYPADALHGDLSQAQRDYVMNRFRKRQIQMLVATDVAARGLDVNELTHVINFNPPDEVESYIHRSGRTGRAGNTGESIIICHSREMRKIRAIERKIKQTIEKGTVPTGKEICKRQLINLIDKMMNVEVDEEAISEFMSDIVAKMEGLSNEEIIKRFVSVEFNRFVNYYKTATDINVQESRGGKDGRSGGASNDKFTRFVINHGKKSGITAKMIIDLVNEHLPKKSVDIGRIDIQSTISFVDIETAELDAVVEAFRNTPYQGLMFKPDEGRPNRGRSSGGRQGGRSGGFRGGRGGGGRRDGRRDNRKGRDRRR